MAKTEILHHPDDPPTEFRLQLTTDDGRLAPFFALLDRDTVRNQPWLAAGYLLKLFDMIDSLTRAEAEERERKALEDEDEG